METIKMAFMALNLTHPEATEAYWLCLQPLLPYFEAFGVNGSYEILDKADICRWENPEMGEMSGLTIPLWQMLNTACVSYTRHPLLNLTCDAANGTIASWRTPKNHRYFWICHEMGVTL